MNDEKRDIDRIDVFAMTHYGMHGTGFVHFRVEEGPIIDDLYLTAEECRDLARRLIEEADQSERWEPSPDFRLEDWPSDPRHPKDRT